MDLSKTVNTYGFNIQNYCKNLKAAIVVLVFFD